MNNKKKKNNDGIRWMSWDEAEAKGLKECEDPNKIAELEKHIFNNRYKFGGLAHQSPLYKGVPVFSDNTALFFSFRAWGGFMARIWGGDYTDYAWESVIKGWNIPGFVKKEGENKSTEKERKKSGIEKVFEALRLCGNIFDLLEGLPVAGVPVAGVIDYTKTRDAVREALKIPKRNCDKYDYEIDAWYAFSKDRGGPDASTEIYEGWLFDKAETEQEKGEVK